MYKEVKMDNEIWAVWQNQYLISNYGRVKNAKTGRILKPEIDPHGYCIVSLEFRQGHQFRRERVKVHRMVALRFIPNYFGLPYVNHIDGNKTNNNITNLEWCTPQQNAKHAVDNGLHDINTFKFSACKLTAEDVKWIKKHYIPRDKDYGAIALGRKFGVNSTTIRDAASGKSYKHIK